MNCDEAFDALTDPTESNHSALKWHLEFCPRCREMQAVLAPALAMFSGNAVSPGDSASASHRLLDLPAQTGPRFGDVEQSRRGSSKPFLTADALRVAEQIARTLRPSRSRVAVRWIMIGAACLMTALGVFFAMNANNSGQRLASEPAMLADRCLWTERDAPPRQAPTEDASSRWVVLSCVACHLEHSVD